MQLNDFQIDIGQKDDQNMDDQSNMNQNHLMHSDFHLATCV